MYLNPLLNPHNYEVFDIETDGFDYTRVWCAVFKNMGTGDRTSFSGANINHDIKAFVDAYPHTIFVGHNSISFDEPALSSLCDAPIPIDRHVDTLVLSYLYNPRLAAPDGFPAVERHSLRSYGARLGFPKVEHEDWSRFSHHMMERCSVDVDLTEQVYLALSGRMREIGYSEQSCELEHRIRKIVDVQEHNGFRFDIIRAGHLCQQLRQRQSDLALEIKEAFPSKLEEMGCFKNKRRKDGSHRLLLGKHLQKYDLVRFNKDETEYKVFSRIPFNIGSPKQRVERLLEAGWRPEAFTKGGQPQADENALLAFSEASRSPEIAMMADWVVLQGRASMIESWLTLVNPDDQCIHGKVFTCGARSRRMTHSGPNTANIPSEQNGARYGRECRELWVARPDRVLVGYDAKSLQMRGFCHYVNNPDVTRLYIEGDPHQANSDSLTEVLGWQVARGGGGAKTLFYAFLFGAQDPKLASILGRTDRKVGKKVRQALYVSTPGLERVMEECEHEYRVNHGRLACVDGGFVVAPSPHSALNYKIQPLEAVVMKQASIFIDQRTREKGIDHLKVGDIHDEGQHDVAVADSHEFGRIACDAVRDAGLTFNLNVPLAGDYKIGNNWSETH